MSSNSISDLPKYIYDRGRFSIPIRRKRRPILSNSLRDNIRRLLRSFIDINNDGKFL